MPINMLGIIAIEVGSVISVGELLKDDSERPGNHIRKHVNRQRAASLTMDEGHGWGQATAVD